MIRVVASIHCDACGRAVQEESVESHGDEATVTNEARVLVTKVLWQSVRGGAFVQLVRRTASTAGALNSLAVKCIPCRGHERYGSGAA